MMTSLYEKFRKAKDIFLSDLQVSSKSKATHDKYGFVLRLFDEWLSRADTYKDEAEVTR